METNGLISILDDLQKCGQKNEEEKRQIDKIKRELFLNKSQLNGVNDNLEKINQQIIQKSVILPEQLTEITANEIEMRSILKQTEQFSENNEILVKKLRNINTELKRAIDVFSNKCLEFTVKYGPKGVFNSEVNEINQRIVGFQSKKYKLISNVEKLKNEIKDIESVENERKSLKDSIVCLENKRNKLKIENSELKAKQKQLMENKKILEELPKSGTEFLELKQKLNNSTFVSASVVRNHSQQNIELKSEFNSNHLSIERAQQPVLTPEKSCDALKRKNSFIDITRNGSEIENNCLNKPLIDLTEESPHKTQDNREKIWENIRKRQMRINNNKRD